MNETMVPPLVEMSDVSLRIGQRTILDSISFGARSGEVIGLVGANGSGKSSLLNVLAGYYRSDQGSIRFAGQEIGRRGPSEIARLGLGRSFQSVGTFRELTLLEYVMVGREPSWSTGLLGDVLGRFSSRRVEAEYSALARRAVADVGIERYADQRLADCPYGVRKVADVVRAAVAGARLLLMDEPTSGVGGAGSTSMRELCNWFLTEAGGESIIMVDHDVAFVRSMCPRVIALSSGSVIADGPTDDVLSAPAVITTFLGRSDR